ncbi:MAG: DUF1456 family protein [Pseudomonadota bacterium]|nr:DUF1456 family protein [Pseudomonadota bacterium]
MNNNDVLRRLRFALKQSDAEVQRLCRLAQVDLGDAELRSYLAKEGDADFVLCPDPVLAALLDGLVLHRRGPRDPSVPRPPEGRFDNNMILKKLRIALELKEPDMLALLELGGMKISASELGGLFRSETHKHYRPCGDQLLRNFLRGLTVKLRGVGAASVEP